MAVQRWIVKPSTLVAAEIAVDVRPAHLTLVRVAVLKAVPAIGDDDPGVVGAHECVELLAVAMFGDLQESRLRGGRGPQLPLRPAP